MVDRICKICGNGFKAPNYVVKKGHGNYCSPDCYHKSGIGKEPWNKGSNITLKPKTGWAIICIVCGKEKYYQINEHKKRKRVYCSPECYHIDSRAKNPTTYSTIHSWVAREYGKADICEECGTTKNVEWANLSHEYKLDISDWKKLCRSHHFKYDYHTGWGEAIKKFPYMRYKK